jgi:hypothetical protein
VSFKSKKPSYFKKGEIRYMLQLNEQLDEIKGEEGMKALSTKIKKEIKEIQSKMRKQSIEHERQRLKLKSKKNQSKK